MPCAQSWSRGLCLLGLCHLNVDVVVGSRLLCEEACREGLAEVAPQGVHGDVRVAVCKAPAPKYFPPQCIRHNEVKTARFGKETFVRDVAFTFPETMQANYLYIGEYWVENGFWASFPPHKHDVENGVEGALDEIYYYEFDKPQGFGIQMVYTSDKAIDEAYRIQHGDAVEIPRGYHPMAVSPGYKNYTLWIMAGPRRGLLSSGEECHKWIVK